MSEHILRELERTLQRPYFQARLSDEQIAIDLALLRRNARLVSPADAIWDVATHPEDDLVLATAVSGQAAYLVTGDTQLQKLGVYQGVTILSPRAFFELLATQSPD